MENKIIDRRELIIYVRTLKFHKKFNRFGNVHYISPQKKYLCLYVDACDLEEILKTIQQMTFVERVETSPKKFNDLFKLQEN